MEGQNLAAFSEHHVLQRTKAAVYHRTLHLVLNTYGAYDYHLARRRLPSQARMILASLRHPSFWPASTCEAGDRIGRLFVHLHLTTSRPIEICVVGWRYSTVWGSRGKHRQDGYYGKDNSDLLGSADFMSGRRQGASEIQTRKTTTRHYKHYFSPATPSRFRFIQRTTSRRHIPSTIYPIYPQASCLHVPPENSVPGRTTKTTQVSRRHSNWRFPR